MLSSTIHRANAVRRVRLVGIADVSKVTCVLTERLVSTVGSAGSLIFTAWTPGLWVMLEGTNGFSNIVLGGDSTDTPDTLARRDGLGLDTEKNSVGSRDVEVQTWETSDALLQDDTLLRR